MAGFWGSFQGHKKVKSVILNVIHAISIYFEPNKDEEVKFEVIEVHGYVFAIQFVFCRFKKKINLL